MRDDRDVTWVEADSGSGFKWFVLGAAIGAGLGLLFAPQPGDHTRRDLVRRGRKLRAQAEEKIGSLSDDLQVRGKRIKEKVSQFAEDVLEEVQEGKQTLERGASSAREELEQRLADARARARAAVAAEGASEEDDE